jgi:hypothetical protein
MSPYHLENDLYYLEVDGEFGCITRIRDKRGGFELITEPRLAENFRVLLPLPDVECNYLLGSQQRLTSARAENDALVLQWGPRLHNERGEFALAVEMRIALVGETIEFTCRMQNGSAYAIAEVWYPIIGGMTGFGAGETGRRAEVLVPTGNAHWRQPIFTDFGNSAGQRLGIPGGEHSFYYPGVLSMPWICLQQPEEEHGLYFAALENIPRVKGIRFALDLGLADGRLGGDWPTAEEEGDDPLGIVMNWTHYPYTPPGEIFEGACVILQCHAGGWRESASLYREWFTGHFPVVDSTDHWLHRETAFVHTMFMLPEDNINLKLKDIPQWGKTARDFGVTSLCIAGWNIGGHDRGYPYYEPDPRLGTWEELEEGIRACHEMGQRVYFFVNCQPVDMTTEWYKKKLHNYRILDPHGEQYFIVNYWGMGTLSARNRFITATPFSEMNPAHPEVRALLIRQMRRLAEIGADGVHIDKLFQTPFDFNPRLKGTSPDRAHHEGILQYVEELLGACREINPEFCFSFEGTWDRLLSFSDVSWWGPCDSMMKEVFPQRMLTAGIEQPYTFNKVNQAMLKGDALLIGPANYLYGMEYPPMRRLFEYIRETIRIRGELLETVMHGVIADASDGIFRQKEPQLSISGALSTPPPMHWTVFRNVKTGKHVILLANLTRDTLQAEGVTLQGADGAACRIHAPFSPTRPAVFPISLQVPGERVLFIEEC